MIAQGFSPRQIFLLDFQRRLGLSFNEISVLDSSLTHRSFLNETNHIDGLTHNERLEFLGDSVLGQVVASLLYFKLKGRPEGELARIKSVVVSEQSLAPIAVKIGIPEALQLGNGEENSGGRAKKALLADALEAVIGAVFLDQGYDAAQRFVSALLEPSIQESIGGQSKDYKTVVQEYAQKYLKELPRYSLEKTEGPEHDRLFWVACRLGKKKYGPCPGKTKKEAEQVVAEDVYATLKGGSALVAKRLAAITNLSPSP